MMNANEGSLRYAVLRHEGVDEPHFDLLFETSSGSMLKTWRLKAWPVMDVQEAQPIRDHRPAFLTYQGTLSGDRGQVMRVDEGTCVAQTLARRVVVDLFPSGQRIVFDQPVDDTWFVRVEGRSPDSAAPRPGA